MDTPRIDDTYLPDVVVIASAALLASSLLTSLGAQHPIAWAIVSNVVLLNDLPATSSLAARSSSSVILGSPLNAPVEDIIVLVTLTDEKVTEELAQIGIIGLIVEAESAAVVEENSEFVREATTKEVGRGRHLLLHNAVVLLLLRRRFQSLPREGATQKVHEDICEGLEIITTSLLNTQVRVDRSVPRRSSQVLVLPVRDVKVSLRVTELLGQSEVDDVDLVATFADAHQEIVGLDVTMNEVARVDVFNARDQLVCKQQNGLQAELAVAKVEKVLQTGTQKVEDHRIVVAFRTEPPHERDSDAASQSLVDLRLIFELWMLRLYRL